MADNCKLCRIALENVSVVRGGQTLLQDVSMHIHCGQLTVLIGQNGAGKTTLIRALLGEYAHGGTIRHVDGEGRDVAHMRTGYVPQHLEFDKEMPVTVEDFLAASLTRRPVWTGVGKKTRAQVMEALKMVEGEKLLHRPLGRCSGGELQRVLLALALHPAPDLLVLDEPVSGVDQNGLQMFLDTVVRLKEHHHMAILLVSHDLNVVRQYADHVVLLDDETKEICKEIVRCGGLDGRVNIALDYFDASINRISAWTVGFRNVQKALLSALLTPNDALRALQDEQRFTELMVRQEALKTMPFGDVWDEYCRSCNVPVGTDWFETVQKYEHDVLSKRV